MSRTSHPSVNESARLAKAGADAWLEAVCENYENLGSAAFADLPAGFDAETVILSIQEAFEREHIATRGPIHDDPDEHEARTAEFLKQAAYMFGVQVGLRMRGGVR